MMVISSRTPEGSANLCPVCGSEIKIEPSNPGGDAPCPNCGHLLWFAWEDLGDTVIVRPTLATLRSEDWRILMDKAAERPGVRLVLDLKDVQFIASAVLGNLMNFKRKIDGVKGRLKIENLHPDLLEVFRITRLDQVFDVGQ
jgi:anti-anti-sigma factor